MSSILINNIDQLAIMSKSLDMAMMLLSLIVIFDILIKFKRPLNLKLSMLVVVMSVMTISFLKYFTKGEFEYLFIFSLAKVSIVMGLLIFFCLLYFLEFKKFMTYFTFIVYTSFFLIQYYVNYNHLQFNYSKGYGYLAEVIEIKGEGFMPIFIILFRTILLLIMFILLSYFLYKIVFKINYNNIYYKKVKVFTITVMLFIVSLICLFAVHNLFKFENLLFNIFTVGYLRLYILLIFLYRPKFLNTASSRIAFSNLFKVNDVSISDNEFAVHFFVNLYFKNSDANCNDFASILNVELADLKKYVNQIYGLTFEELVDKNRIEYFVEIIKDPGFKNYTVEALAKEVGFTARSSFYKPFKRFHGGNPSDLINAYWN